MAASGQAASVCADSKQTLHDAGNRDVFRDCVGSVLASLTEFCTKLNVGEGVLSVNVQNVNVSGLLPSHVYICLQHYISKLQSISENLKLIEGDSNGPNPLTCQQEPEETSDQMEVDQAGVPPTSQHCTVHEDHSKTDDNVQIKAGKSEIERRISAFIERKQLEINENNVREFCNVIDCNQEDSCARTDAVFTPYPGFKSHVKVTRVVNTYGPQTRKVHSELGDHQQSSIIRDCGNPAIEERLYNMEAHLKLPPAGPVPQSVYQRLKKLEDRILELEGLSPEYFHSTNFLHKRPKASVSQNCSLAELDGKISAVKAALLKKTSAFQATDAGEFPF